MGGTEGREAPRSERMIGHDDLVQFSSSTISPTTDLGRERTRSKVQSQEQLTCRRNHEEDCTCKEKLKCYKSFEETAWHILRWDATDRFDPILRVSFVEIHFFCC
jgi:hypothetical protein